MKFTESTVEEATLEWFQELGYDYHPGPEIAHDSLFAERKGCEDIVLGTGCQSAPEPLSPGLPPVCAAPAAAATLTTNQNSAESKACPPS